MTYQEPNPKAPRFRLVLSFIPYRGKWVGSLAAVVYMGLVWVGYAVASTSKNKLNPAVLIRRPSEAYPSLSIPISRSANPAQNAPQSSLSAMNQVKANRPTPVAYRPKSITPTSPVPGTTPAFSDDQISELEKELNGVRSSPKP